DWEGVARRLTAATPPLRRRAPAPAGVRRSARRPGARRSPGQWVRLLHRRAKKGGSTPTTPMAPGGAKAVFRAPSAGRRRLPGTSTRTAVLQSSILTNNESPWFLASVHRVALANPSFYGGTRNLIGAASLFQSAIPHFKP